ncbi:phenylalanine--tRNA ligase beta subunit-related protein [Gottschalkiaceae bacterium SANA]|nr:phenylalanine--tRNA ligase beta subunit-related protein [Gottschalkiaceae bacterium SANA]
MQIKIDERWKGWAPNLQIGSIVAEVVVDESSEALNAELNGLVKKIEESLIVPDISKEPAIAAMRKAYRTLGKDPTKYRVSSEALLRRIGRGLGLYRVNNVVEINNYLSMKSRCPVCAYDIGKIDGDIQFSAAPAGTFYEGIGRGMLNIEFLPVFMDHRGAFGSLTSDSARTCISEETKTILFNLVSVHPHEDMESWILEAAELLKAHAQGQIEAMKIWNGTWMNIKL